MNRRALWTVKDLAMAMRVSRYCGRCVCFSIANTLFWGYFDPMTSYFVVEMNRFRGERTNKSSETRLLTVGLLNVHTRLRVENISSDFKV